MQVEAVPSDRWDIILTRRQWHDDEVYLQRRRQPIVLGYSQWHMQITLIMMFDHQKSLQIWFLLVVSQG
jgi:hypothetical protein